jgi:multidrug efflux system membrane fusion protein
MRARRFVFALMFALAGGGADAASPPDPVTASPVKRQDVPVLLDGLGTVQAFNTVEIKAQVTGTLIAIPVQEGQEVHKGDVVAEIDPRPYKAALDQAIAQRNKDVAQLNGAELDLKRYQDLAKRSFAPVQQVDDQQATVSAQQAAVGVDTALIETAQINLDYCSIRAPFDGRVGLYQLNAGNLVTASAQTGIISITQDKPVAVVLTLPEADLPRVRDAQLQGKVPVIAVDGSGEKQLAAGTLLTPNNTIDTTTGTITLKAVFPNQDSQLWPGQFVNTRVQVGVIRNAWTVPNLAIQHGPDGTFVFTIKQDGTADQVAVETGDQMAGWTVVTKGLSGTETVVVSGQSRLTPGTRVTTPQAPPA